MSMLKDDVLSNDKQLILKCLNATNVILISEKLKDDFDFLARVEKIKLFNKKII